MIARAELREKVEHRQKLLTQALKASEAAGHQAEKIAEINFQLNAVADELTGDWDTMADVTAQRLTDWLEESRNLVAEDA